MRLLGLIFGMVFVMGCAQKNQIYDVPAELQPYVDLFVKEAYKRGQDVSVSHLTMMFTHSYDDKPILATCTYADNVIRIGKAFWDWAGPTTREQVVFHEFGHCLLGRDHDNGSTFRNNEYIPKSIMSQYLFPEYYYATYRTYYLNELFNGRLYKAQGEINETDFDFSGSMPIDGMSEEEQ